MFAKRIVIPSITITSKDKKGRYIGIVFPAGSYRIFVVLHQHQNTQNFGLSTAEFDGVGWINCSEPGQPDIVQYFNPNKGRFVSGKPTDDIPH